MSTSIEQAVMQIKHDVSKAFDAAAIVALCRSIGYSWRTRQFDPVATIQRFLLQVLHGRHAGVAAGLWSTIRAGSWLRLSRRTCDDTLSRGHWNAAADSDCANADTRPRASHSHARGIGTRRCRARGSWILLFFPYGNALAVRHARATKPAVSADEARPRLAEITLVTTLLDAKQYPAADLAELYGKRWQVETNLRHLKQTLHIDVLRTKSVDGIHKELAMFAIVYNLVRLVMLEAAQRQGVMPDRISFVDALRWLVAAGTGLPLRRIRVLPLRPDRHEPRVRKRRPKNYPLMTKPRAELMQALSAQRLKP
jgi:hypothetical protein